MRQPGGPPPDAPPTTGRGPLRVAAIGAGYIADVQLGAWRDVPGVELVGLCDRDLTRARAVTERLDLRVPLYGDAGAMLRDAAPDAVDILASPDVHRELARCAAESGRAVLCQKPLATTLEDARAIVADCRARGARLMVNENFRWRPSFRWIKGQLEAGALGRVFYAGYDARINVTRPSSEWPRSRFFTRRPFFLGMDRLILLENTIHWIDVSRFLFGEPRTVYCRTRRSTDFGAGEDTAVVVLEFEGLTVVIQNAWGSYGYPYPSTEAQVAIEGTEGTILVDRAGQARLVRADGAVQTADYDLATYHRASFVRAQAHFAAAVATGAPFETHGEDNLRTLAVTFAAYRSADENRVVGLTEDAV